MYIVTRGGSPLELGKDNVFWYGFTVTLFFRYENARNAVRRTKRYPDSREYNWDRLGEYKIVPLVTEGM